MDFPTQQLISAMDQPTFSVELNRSTDTKPRPKDVVSCNEINRLCAENLSYRDRVLFKILSGVFLAIAFIAHLVKT